MTKVSANPSFYARSFHICHFKKLIMPFFLATMKSFLEVVLILSVLCVFLALQILK
jgi:hypothetical protein